MVEILQLNPNTHMQSVDQKYRDRQPLQEKANDAHTRLTLLEAREEGLAREIIMLKEEEDHAGTLGKRAIFRAKPKKAEVAREARADAEQRRKAIEENLHQVTEDRLAALKEFVHLDLQKDGQKKKGEPVSSYTEDDQRNILEILHILEQLINPKEYKILPASWSSFGYKNKLRKNWFTGVLGNTEFLIDQYCQDTVRKTIWKSMIRKQHDTFNERRDQVYARRQNEGKAAMERDGLTKEEEKIVANTVADVQHVEYVTVQIIEYFTREMKRPAVAVSARAA